MPPPTSAADLYRQPPSPSFFPQHPSSYSTLSPLAPPFTVDRLPAPSAPPQPPPITCPEWAPHSTRSVNPPPYYPPPSAPLRTSLGQARHAAPYYPPPPSAPVQTRDTCSDWSRRSITCPDWSARSTSGGVVDASGQYYPPPSAPIQSGGSQEAGITCSDWSPRSTSGRVKDAAPYYPYYPPPARDGLFDGEGRVVGSNGKGAWMDQLSTVNGDRKKGTAAECSVECEDSWGPWHGKLVGSSARKDHFGSECSDWLDNQHPGIHEDYVKAPCNILEMPVLDSSVSHKGSPYLHSMDPTSVMEDHNSYSSNFTYDSYINHLVSCSTDTMAYYPATCSSAQTYTPLPRRTSSSVDCRMSTNTYPTSQIVNPYKARDDNEDSTMGKKKEFNINQNAESKEGYYERTKASIKTIPSYGSSVESSLKMNNFLLGSDLSYLTTVNSTACPTETNCGSRSAHLDLRSPFPYAGSSVKLDDVMHTSLEVLDQPVDSPCWRGAPLSRHCQIGVAEEIDPHPSVREVPRANSNPLVEESMNSINLAQHQKHEASVLDPSHDDGSQICMSGSNSSHLCPLRELQLPVSLPSKGKDFEDADGNLSYYTKPETKIGVQHLQVLGGESVEAFTKQKGNSEPKECDGKPLGHQGTGVSIDLTTIGGETNLGTGQDAVSRESKSVHGYCLSPGKDSQVLVKALHSLSEMLLSMYCGDAHELEERDHEIVQLVIDNLKALTLESKKGTIKDNARASRDDNATKHDHTKMNTFMKETKHCMRRSMCSDKFEINQGGAKECGGFRDMTQILEKDVEESLDEQEENHQALLYKNLWIEAEAALCSLKYASLKLQGEKHKNQNNAYREIECINKITLASTSPSFKASLDGQDIPSCKSTKSLCSDLSTREYVLGKDCCTKSQEANTNQPSKLDVSTMARYRVLTDRQKNFTPSGAGDQEKYAMNSSMESENNIRPMFRQEKSPDLVFLEGDLQASSFTENITQGSRRPSLIPALDGQVLTQCESLKNLHDLSTRVDIVGKDGYTKPQEVIANLPSEVDAVMSRYKVLTERHEKSSSTGTSDQENLAVGSPIHETGNNSGAKFQQPMFPDFGFMEGNLLAPKFTESITQGSRRLSSMPVVHEQDMPKFMAMHNPYEHYSTPDGLVDNNDFEKSQNTDASQASDVYASVMARYRALTLRDEKLSSGPKIKDNTGARFERPKLADLGFMEGNPQAHTEAEPRDGDGLVKLRSGSHRLGAYNEQNRSAAINLEQAIAMGSHIWTANGLVNGNRKHILSGGDDSGSSDWEHVFNEDFTWYNHP